MPDHAVPSPPYPDSHYGGTDAHRPAVHHTSADRLAEVEAAAFDGAGEEEVRRAQRLVAEWLLGYRSPATRFSYADALGLDRAWVRALTSGPVSAPGGPDAQPDRAGGRRPPTRPGRFRDLAWLRWCGRHGVHALRATAAHVKRWQLDMDAAGVPKSTRSHRLAVVGSLYAFWTGHGAVAGDPTRFDRRGLALGSAGDTGRAVVLTAAQVDRLLTAAAAPRRGRSPVQRLRAVAVVALFTLGLRVGELTALRREDLHTTRQRRALYVRGKGGKARVVYLSDLAARALADYLGERDRHDATATPALAGTVGSRRSPLIATGDGGPLDPRDVWALLRRLAAAAGPLLDDLVDRMHPHLLRHFYVTTAAEGGADMTDVQADVGHASVDTTNRVYNQAARHPDRSAVDLVEQALLRTRATTGRPLARDSTDATLLALRTGLAHGDPVELLHGLQQLDRALTDATMPSADARTALELVDAALGSADSHDRVAALAVQVRQRLTGSPDT